MEGQEIIYTSECQRCDEHKTELGILLSIKESVEKEFGGAMGYSSTEIMQMIICWFNNYKLDERTKFISQQKKDTTAQIQKYKKANIEAINK